MKRKNKLVFLLTAAALIAITGCSGEDGAVGPQGPAGEVEPFVNGLVVRSNYEDYYQQEEIIDLQVLVSVNNVSTVPSVYVNDEEIPASLEGMVYSAGYSFWGGLFLDMGDSATLAVNYSEGGENMTAGAAVAVPDTFDLLSSPGDPLPLIISPAGSLDVEWESAAGAEKYWLVIDYDGSYIDNSGNEIDFDRSMITSVRDTTFTLYGSDIFPDRDDIDYYTGFGGNIYIYAVDGPISPGDEANVSGDAAGTFAGVTECSRYVRFAMLIPLTGEIEYRDRKEPDIFELMKRFTGMR